MKSFALMVSVFLGWAMPANADTFHYSFTNIDGGTVTGTVYLNAANTAATGVSVDGNSSGFGIGILYTGSAAWDNSFTVVNGQIVSANFSEFGIANGFCCSIALIYNWTDVPLYGPLPVTEEGLTNSPVDMGFVSSGTIIHPDLSFANPVVVTPLPGALPLFATGLGVLGLIGWRRRK